MQQNKFVLDTNIWIGVFHKNRVDKLIDSIIVKDYILISCKEQHKEFLHILYYYERIQKLLKEDYNSYIDLISAITDTHETNKRFALINDYKDNYLVDLAWQTKSILVTEDKDFKLLKKLKRPKIDILNRTEFYTLLGW
jgi:putative PIN family toxin of toxin-antitoxin system